MRNIGIIVFKYSLVSIPIMLLSEYMTDTWISVVLDATGLAVLLLMLLDLGKLIKSEYIKSNYIRCISIVVGAFTIALVLTRVFNVPATNNWIASVFNFVVFSTIGITLFKAARYHTRSENEIVGCLLYVLTLAVIIIAIIIGVLFLVFD